MSDSVVRTEKVEGRRPLPTVPAWRVRCDARRVCEEHCGNCDRSTATGARVEASCELDISHISRRTVEERDYWIDQLVREVTRLRSAQAGEAWKQLAEAESALANAVDELAGYRGAKSSLVLVRRSDVLRAADVLQDSMGRDSVFVLRLREYLNTPLVEAAPGVSEEMVIAEELQYGVLFDGESEPRHHGPRNLDGAHREYDRLSARDKRRAQLAVRKVKATAWTSLREHQRAAFSASGNR